MRGRRRARTAPTLNAYRLAWALLKHIAHGRGRDVVWVHVDVDEPAGVDGGADGVAVEFRWESDADAFCVIRGEEPP